MTLEERYQTVARRVAGRAQLVAVSKGHPVEALRRLHALGQRAFGENRVDELLGKRAAMPDDVEWHYLGALQRNKLKALRETRPIVHGFDRIELAADLGLPAYVQVNLAGEAQKSGVPRDEAAALARALGPRCLGFSLLPPREGDPRPWFRELRALRDEVAPGLGLSMGMSADYEAAIEEGATVVRVGTAIFGPRGA